MTDVAKVTNILTKNIEPNPHNPRRLFDEVPMKILKDSIAKLGILVPLDVYPEDSNKTDPNNDTFVLLDGERRWRCSKELNIQSVPCIIIDSPSPQQNILTMFHIHNVREGWQLMPTALKLKDLMKMLDTENERNLAELTKLSISQVRRCKILLTYPDEFQSMMLAPKSERYKADLFIDMHRIRGPALEDKLPPWMDRGDKKCIEILIKKYDDDIIKAVTEFRHLKTIYTASIEKHRVDKFIQEFDRFLSDPEMGIFEINIPGATYAKYIKEITRSSKRLLSQIEDIDFENISTDLNLIKQLRKLSQIIDEKLDKALLNDPKKKIQE